jgi:transposase-like protein
MIEVVDAAAAHQALARRALPCPDCGAALQPWGRARSRTVRDVDQGVLRVRPDRGRCTGCGKTHVVLTAPLLPHRAYTVAVIGQALLGAARGRGHRPIAAELAAPEATVRSWIRRARRTAHHLWTLGVQAVVALEPDALPTRDLPDPLACAIEALVAAAVTARRRFGAADGGLWSQIAVLTRGRLLAPSLSG